MGSYILFSISVLLHPRSALTEVPSMAKYYCVIGAGPAGLQMAYYLHRAQRDYIVFEQANSPGSFFERYPRHRKLISPNQRQTGSSNKEFNLRHDLNSLISDDDSLRFTEYSEQHFPTAEELIHYLSDYQKKLNLAVQFDTKIGDLRYDKDAKNDRCRYTMFDQHKNYYCCRNVFIATGWRKSKLPEKAKGLEYVETYETMSTDPNDYKGRSVLIIGRGFSGFETALSLEGSAAVIHMASSNRIRLNWEAQYLGDVRNSKNDLLDSMLRDIEGFFEVDVEKVQFTKEPSGKIRAVTRNGSTKDDEANRHLLREGYDRVILCLGFEWDDSIFHSSTKVASFDAPRVPKRTYPDMGDDFQSKEHPGLFFLGPLMHALDYRKSAGGFIHGFRNAERALHRLLEWRNHGVRWPSATKSVDQLVPTLLKRANEASAIYHMFAFLCDLAIYDRTSKKFAYLEEFPISLLPTLLKNSGYEFDPSRHSAFILTYQYGIDLSRPGVDRFRGTRTRKRLETEQLSNILHPVVYYYSGTLPTGEDARGADDVLPDALAVHHILQDIAKEHDGPAAHIAWLRRFVESLVEEDLRSFTPDTCVHRALTQNLDDDGALPPDCNFRSGKLDTVLSYH